MNALLITVLSLLGQTDCPGGICPAPTASVKKVEAVNNIGEGKYAWDKITDSQYVLRRDGSIVGQWYVPEGNYYQWMHGKNYGPMKPPIDPPTSTVAANFGLAMEEWKISGVTQGKVADEETVTFGGRVIHKGKMQEAFEGKLSDDSDKGYIIIIAKDDKKRDAAFQDYLKVLPEDFRARYNLWMADPSHFTMQDRYNGKPRFHSEGEPTVILQNSKGEVLFRRPQANQVYQQADFKDLLKSDPNYKPTLDPGAPQSPTPFNLDAKTTGYLAVAVVGILAIRRKYNNAVS